MARWCLPEEGGGIGSMRLEHKYVVLTYKDTGAPCILRKDRIVSKRRFGGKGGGTVIEYDNGMKFVVREEAIG